MKTALVTGAAGFLGSHLCDKLLNEGWRVIGVDNFFRGKKENLPTHPNFHFYDIDLAHPELNMEYKNTLQYAFEEYQPEVIFHYAAINGTLHFYDKPYQVLTENEDMLRNMLDFAVKQKCVKKFVFTSSSEVYGHDPVIPTKETEPIMLNVFTPRDSYASSKAIGEFHVKLTCEENNIDYLIIRPFNTYGPRMDNTKYGQVIPELIKRANSNDQFTLIGDGTQTRSFCWVGDHVDIVVDFLLDNAKNEILNIGSQEQVTIDYLANEIHGLMGKKYNPAYLPSREHDTLKRQPSLKNLRKYIGDYEFTLLDWGLNQLI